jgi:signal transduction histidine kinase
VIQYLREVNRPTLRPSDRRWPSILRLVAHQLRIPTSLIAGYSEMLASDEIQRDPRRRQQILEQIAQNLRELNRLATELQEGSRAESGGLPMRKGSIVVSSLIEETLQAAAPLCEYRKARLESSIRAAAIERHIVGDRFYLKLCLVNLIDNAAKYGKPGGRVRLVTEPAGPSVKVRVVDDGMGLGPNAAQLFAPFTQGSDTKEGIGLGLTLVKAIVEAHGGSITWRSGKGSYVGFTIPWSPN